MDLFIYIFFRTRVRGVCGEAFWGRHLSPSLCGRTGRALHTSATARKQCQWSINMTMGGGLWRGCLTAVWVCLFCATGAGVSLSIMTAFNQFMVPGRVSGCFVRIHCHSQSFFRPLEFKGSNLLETTYI